MAAAGLGAQMGSFKPTVAKSAERPKRRSPVMSMDEFVGQAS